PRKKWSPIVTGTLITMRRFLPQAAAKRNASAGGGRGQPKQDSKRMERRRNPVLDLMDRTHSLAADMLHRGHRVRFATGPEKNRPELANDKTGSAAQAGSQA